MEPKKVLVAAQHYGATNATVPVIRGLRERGHEVVVLGHNQAESGYPNKGIGCETSEAYGVPNELSQFTPGSGRNLLDTISPDLVFTGSSTERGYFGFENSLILAANQRGTPNAMVVDMWAESDIRFRPYHGEPFVPGKVFVLDESHKSSIEAQGVPASQIYVTGNPAFEDFARSAMAVTPERKEEIIERLGGLSTKFVLGYIGNASKKDSISENRGYWDLDNIRRLNEALPEIPELTVFATLHGRMPKEEVAEIDTYLANNGNERFIRFVQGEIKQTDLIYVSDVIATPFSTDGVNAAIAGIPVLSMQGDDLVDRLGTNNAGVTYRVRSQDDMGNLITGILGNKRQREVLFPNLESFIPDGTATSKIIGELESLV